MSGNLALLTQKAEIGEQMLRARGKGRDGRLAVLSLNPCAEIEPALKLAGIVAPGGWPPTGDKKLDRHFLAREVRRKGA